jgi:hypothetical protein
MACPPEGVDSLTHCNQESCSGFFICYTKFMTKDPKPLKGVKGHKEISGGVVHELPADLKKALARNPEALETWEDITPLARNEWICWVISAKKAETRNKRIEWGSSNLKKGKRRPCCWPGCSHR